MYVGAMPHELKQVQNRDAVVCVTTGVLAPTYRADQTDMGESSSQLYVGTGTVDGWGLTERREKRR